MKERSQAKAISASVPAKQLPGSISATSEREVTSMRFNVRFQLSQDLAHQPVALVGLEERVVGAAPGRIALRLEDPDADLGLVEAQVQDGIVQLARRARSGQNCAP